MVIPALPYWLPISAILFAISAFIPRFSIAASVSESCKFAWALTRLALFDIISFAMEYDSVGFIRERPFSVIPATLSFSPLLARFILIASLLAVSMYPFFVRAPNFPDVGSTPYDMALLIASEVAFSPVALASAD